MRKALTSFSTNRFTGIRNQTILLLFLDTGMRLAELSGIDLSEINFDEGFILVHGKGRKERWVPFEVPATGCDDGNDDGADVFFGE